MTDLQEPGSLAAALNTAFTRLGEGASSASSAFHLPVLATLGLGGDPRCRSVVLRAFDPSARLLDIHTDVRSAKVAELLRQPRASLHFWDAAPRLQLRLEGHVACHTGDAEARASWDRLASHTRGTYRVTPGPGTVIATPAATGSTDEDAAFDNFTLLRFTLHTLEWLHLEHGRYARARFAWENGQHDAMWLVP